MKFFIPIFLIVVANGVLSDKPIQWTYKDTIELGDEVRQLSLNVMPETIYRVELNKNSSLCTQYRYKEYTCSLTVVISKMECYAPNSLEITPGSKDGELPSLPFCRSGVDFYGDKYSNLDYIEATDTLSLQSFGNFSVTVVISAILKTSGRSDCPYKYVDCYTDSNERSCIPKEWTCDRQPNCPSSYSRDESAEYYCYNDYYGCWGSDYYSYGYDGFYGWAVAMLLALVIIGYCVIILLVRCICPKKQQRPMQAHTVHRGVQPLSNYVRANEKTPYN